MSKIGNIISDIKAWVNAGTEDDIFTITPKNLPPQPTSAYFSQGRDGHIQGFLLSFQRNN